MLLIRIIKSYGLHIFRYFIKSRLSRLPGNRFTRHSTSCSTRLNGSIFDLFSRSLGYRWLIFVHISCSSDNDAEEQRNLFVYLVARIPRKNSSWEYKKKQHDCLNSRITSPKHLNFIDKIPAIYRVFHLIQRLKSINRKCLYIILNILVCFSQQK